MYGPALFLISVRLYANLNNTNYVIRHWDRLWLLLAISDHIRSGVPCGKGMQDLFMNEWVYLIKCNAEEK